MFIEHLLSELSKDQFYCYIWHDPKTGFPVWVGKGRNNRYRDIIGRNNLNLDGFIIENLLNYIPVYLIPCKTDLEALEVEEELIALFKRIGYAIFNIAHRGGAHVHTAATRLKISTIEKGRSPELKAELVKKRLDKMEARPQELKDLEAIRRSSTLRLTHSKKTPAERSLIGKKCYATKCKRLPEIIADEIRRTSESNKRTHALIPKDVKQEQCRKGWETRRHNRQLKEGSP